MGNRATKGKDGLNRFERLALKEQEQLKTQTGRTLKFGSPAALEEKINNYFKECDEQGRPYTIAGLAYFLDCDRQTIYNYAIKDEFVGIIKRARGKILASFEERTVKEGKPGQIFIMKNYGYSDKLEIEAAKEVTPDLSGLSIEEIKTLVEKLN